MTLNKSISHILFDIDGLLLDTETIYDTIFGQFLSEYGHKFSWDVKKDMMGRNRDIATQLCLDRYEVPLKLEEAKEKLNILYEEWFPKCSLMPGADKLVRYLHRSKVPMAAATGSDQESFALKSRNHQDLFSKFSHVVLSDDPELKHGKPDPDIFLLAASRFDEKAEPSRTLVFEDALLGVEAAVAAGMLCVWVTDKSMEGWNATKTVDSAIVIKSLEDFNPAEFGLPPYPR